jgi:hypothetical protein
MQGTTAQQAVLDSSLRSSPVLAGVIPLRKMMKLFSIFFVIILAPFSYSNEKALFPSTLLGKWAPEIEYCAGDFNNYDGEYTGKWNVVITEHAVELVESTGMLISLIKSGSNYVVNLEMSGEGDTWTENQAYILSEGGNRLLRKFRGHEKNYIRCGK